MLKHDADLFVDRVDPERAIQIMKSISKWKLRFGLDTGGKDSALLLVEAMQQVVEGQKRLHLVGLTGCQRSRRKGWHTSLFQSKLFMRHPRSEKE
jgi:hypothetical protein